MIIYGTPLSGGVATGQAFFYEDILSRNTVVRSVTDNRLDDEMLRITTAISHVSNDIQTMTNDALQDNNVAASGIFTAQKEMLNDGELKKELKIELDEQHINAEQAIRNVFRRLSEKLRLSDSEIIRSKVDDIEDLGLRILRILTGHEWNPLVDLPENSIVIAKRLLPSDTVHIKKKNLKGIIIEKGSNFSHSTILAKSFGITCITNLNKPLGKIKPGEQLLLDGNTGVIIVNPTERDIAEYKAKKSKQRQDYNKIRKHANKPVKTKEGRRIKIYANAYSEDDFRTARENNCDGIGLVRLEQLYMSARKLPSEGEIVTELSGKFEKLPDKQITVRLLDIGGDKTLAYLKPETELNPSMGLRGIRFLLKHKGILKTQLRAMLKLNKKFRLRILLPMVTTCGDIKETKDILDECKAELEKETRYKMRDLELGAMLETPASVMFIEDILKYVEFISIGSNDLVQYLMVACRENPEVSHYYIKGYELVFKLIKQIIEKIGHSRKELYICGEFANDTKWTSKLINAGISCLSVPPYCIPAIKEKIRSL